MASDNTKTAIILACMFGVTALVSAASYHYNRLEVTNPVTGILSREVMGPEFMRAAADVGPPPLVDNNPMANVASLIEHQKKVCEVLPSLRIRDWPMAFVYIHTEERINSRTFRYMTRYDNILVVTAQISSPFGLLETEVLFNPDDPFQIALGQAEIGKEVLISGEFTYDPDGCFQLNEDATAVKINITGMRKAY